MPWKMSCLAAVGLVLGSTVYVIAQEVGTGYVLFEYWNSCASPGRGREVFVRDADSSEWRPGFVGPTDRSDFCAVQARAFLFPPADGQYTFWISGGGQDRLWLSSNEDPSNSVSIISVSGWAPAGDSRKSAPVTLRAGRTYFIMAQQTGSSDSTAVSWAGPVVGSSPVAICPAYLAAYIRSPEPLLLRAHNPQPADGITGGVSPVFRWNPGTTAVTHAVYFGTNPTPGSAEFRGNQTSTTYTDPAPLVLGTTYYWRVDESDGAGNTYPGAVWKFTPVAAIPHNLQWQQFLSGLNEIVTYAIAADSRGNVYVSGTGKDSTSIARILQKYSPDGRPLNGPTGPGTFWFAGFAESTLYRDFPWHKIVVDENHGKVYVLYACWDAQAPASDDRTFWLASHEMSTGEKSPGWNATTRLVGHSTVLRGGLAVDSHGDVWTVLEGVRAFVPDGSCFGLEVKKWSGSTGTSIAAAAIDIFTPGKHKHLAGFAIRPTDDAMYTVYREVPLASGQPPIDLVVSLWGSNSQFIKRHETTIGVPTPDDPTEVCHPVFHNCCVDASGALTVGGYYSYDRQLGPSAPLTIQQGFGWDRRFVPVVLRFTSDLDPVFQYISDLTNLSNVPFIDTHCGFIERVEGRIALAANNMVVYRLVPSFINLTPVVLLDNAGQRIASEGVTARSWVEYPSGSRAFYDMDSYNTRTYDMGYIPSTDTIVETGPAHFWSPSPLSAIHPWDIHGALVICYSHRPPPTTCP